MDLLLMRALSTKLNLVHKLHLESERGGSIGWQGPQRESHLALWKCRMWKGWPWVQMCLLTKRGLERASNKKSKRFWQYKTNFSGSLLSNCYLAANLYVRYWIIDGVMLGVIRFIQALGYCLFSMSLVLHESHLICQWCDIDTTSSPARNVRAMITVFQYHSTVQRLIIDPFVWKQSITHAQFSPYGAGWRNMHLLIYCS